jgi:hypothetical protein
MKARKLLMIVAVFWFGSALTNQIAIAQVTPSGYLDVNVRIEHPVGSGDFINRIVLIPTEHPNHAPGTVTFGTSIRYEGNASLKTNCTGQKYNHFVVSIDDNWVVSIQVDGQPRNVSKADNERYWDYYYRDYTKVFGIDYTKSCHGYAFGVGDWPMSAFEIIRESIPPHPDDCYRQIFNHADWIDVEIASDRPDHSIKITGDQCEVEVGSNPPTIEMQAIVKTSSEKFRESGVYEQAGNCQNPVDLNLAHSREGGHGPYAFLCFKRKQPQGGGGGPPKEETPGPIN